MSKQSNSFNPARLAGLTLNGLARIAPQLTGRLAFDLFCWPRRRSVKPEEAAFLATADVVHETVGDRRVAVYCWGFRGPVVLLAHGWESHAGRWRKLAPRLVEAGYQVVAVDAPGHGRSPGRHFNMVLYAEVLRTLLQRYGPIEAVIGHSVGGAAAIWALGTVSPAFRPSKAIVLAAFSELQTVMDGARHSTGVNRRVMDGFNNYLIKRVGQPVEHYSVARMATRLQGVDGLLIHDRGDRVTPFRESLRLAEAWPGARLWETQGFGHGLTAPAVIDAVLDFVTSYEASAEIGLPVFERPIAN
jgi:pimeloyl-ACP methyl ester carboxylesterase